MWDFPHADGLAPPRAGFAPCVPDLPHKILFYKFTYLL